MIRDPFDIHRKNTLRATALRAAQNIKDTAAHVGANALDMTSFSIPKNVPNFGNPDRDLEDRAWASLSGSRGIVGDVQSRVTSMFDKDTLPMYKDKPMGYAPSHRRRPWWKKKRTLAAFSLAVLTLLYLFGFFSSDGDLRPRPSSSNSGWSWMGSSQASADWDARRGRVVEAFELSWDAYERYAWGKAMQSTPQLLP
jgi:endoplasmic reticulum Man9GlcNAc2 1,2-alpha-mannosidase